MKVNLPPDDDLKDAVRKLSRDKSLVDSFMKTFNDVLGSYHSGSYIFGDYCAFIGSSTFINYINTNRSKNSATNFFNRQDDALWSYGILALSILLGIDSQKNRHRSVYCLEEDLKKLGVSNAPALDITDADKQKIKDYRNNRIAHWNYRDETIKNLEYKLPIDILNKIRNYIIEVYFILTNGGYGLQTVKERAIQRSRAVAELFDCNGIVKDMIKDLSDIPEEKWTIPNSKGAAI